MTDINPLLLFLFIILLEGPAWKLDQKKNLKASSLERRSKTISLHTEIT